MKKLALILLFSIMLAGTAFAYNLSKQEFEIKVDDKGFGVITEKYYFTFLGSEDLNAFMQAVKKNGQDLLVWQVFDERINPYFETPEIISLIGFSFDPKTNVLELKYSTDNQIAQKAVEDPRSTTWRLKPGFLQKFEQGTLIIVPKSIKISIEFPQAAELKTELLPPTVQTTKNSLLLNNVRVNSLNIQYVIPKPIAQTISLSEIIDWLKNTGLIYVILAALIVLGVVAVIKRKSISERIENYLVEHSEISSREEEEEIEIEE